MGTVLASMPAAFFEVTFSEHMIPGRQPELGLTAGSNCQRYAYAVLRHFGLAVPDFRSSDLWTDKERMVTVSEPAPLDLVLYAASPDPRGAHVGVYLGGTAVLHLCKEIGLPIVWDFKDFAARERYRSLIGFKRCRPMEMKAGRQRPRPPEASTVVAYDPAWAQLFESLSERLGALLDGVEALIEHVGSTAVPGLAAKPIVDIDVVVPSAADIPEAVHRLESGGYIHRGDLGIPGREAFDVPPDLPYHHLYVVAAGTKPHLDHVLLRDYLRSHPNDAARYGRRKLDVAHLITTESRQAYMEAKAAVVEELLGIARREHTS